MPHCDCRTHRKTGTAIAANLENNTEDSSYDKASSPAKSPLYGSSFIVVRGDALLTTLG